MIRRRLDENKIRQVPGHVLATLVRLRQEGYKSYLVGGCVRDLLLNRKPNDWDIATQAKPHQIERTFRFDKILYTGVEYGTVTIKVGEYWVQITTFRKDIGSINKRRPASVEFSRALSDDIWRRDLTINSLAYYAPWIFDITETGLNDLQNRIIRFVYEHDTQPEDRIEEDALRMLRAVRFASQLGFEIDAASFDAIKTYAHYIQEISKERIQEEFVKLLMGKYVTYGLRLFERSGLLKQIIPEAQKMVYFDQKNIHHNKDVWEHTLDTIAHVPNSNTLKLAAFFHDIGKPGAFKFTDGQGHFHFHAENGAEITKRIMRRLKFGNGMIGAVCKLVQYHMRLSKNHHDVTPKGIRRLVREIGWDYFDLWVYLCTADIIASNPPFDFRWVDKVIEVAKHVRKEEHALKVSDLAINGYDVMQLLDLKPGPEVGYVLDRLMDSVLEEPQMNEKATLVELAEAIWYGRELENAGS
jgi:tRNA nucleotidyltransferase (CCA-adding enzyme)